eukprot:4832657-Pleurochrysis_carterae.AAC.1
MGPGVSRGAVATTIEHRSTVRTTELNEFNLFHFMAKPPKPQSPDEVALQAAAAPAFAAGEASSILRSP